MPYDDSKDKWYVTPADQATANSNWEWYDRQLKDRDVLSSSAAKTHKELSEEIKELSELIGNQSSVQAKEVLKDFSEALQINTADAVKALGDITKAFVESNPCAEADVEVAAPKKDLGSPLGHRSSEMLVFYPRSAKRQDYDADTFNAGPVSYLNITDLLATFFITAHAEYGKIRNWREHVIGITSCSDPLENSKHVPMFDYDGKNIKTRVRKDVKTLQDDFGLGPAWVYKTKGGIHVYFFANALSKSHYLALVESSNCCKGFKKATINNGYGTLRVSAKYTDFDIKLEYVLKPSTKKVYRMGRKGHVVNALLAMGQQCGTHLASLYPQWAYYTEDYKVWRPDSGKKKKTGKIAGLYITKQQREVAKVAKNHQAKFTTKILDSGLAYQATVPQTQPTPTDDEVMFTYTDNGSTTTTSSAPLTINYNDTYSNWPTDEEKFRSK
jgi:hypothetical protein